MEQALRILKEYFGHDSFRPGQDKIVEQLLSGRDALCIMPTGAGKSICYQVPALLFSGITLVVSPLISLMKDQVNALCQAGVAAAYLNTSLTPAQYNKAVQNMAAGKYRIIYVAPERLCVPEFLRVCSSLNISLLAVDEAHCVSQWGQDFRPSYLKIVDFISSLPRRPVIGAFTATATAFVQEDIARILQLREPLSITTGFDRPNLFFSVIKPKEKLAQLIKLVRERHGKAGIIYCATRKAVEKVCAVLQEKGYSATRYHAGLPEEERRKNQDDFINDRRLIMVATNAFGMGIDKSNVSYVLHYNMPKSMEAYYQEAGRAGRDGTQADCILLYSPQDVRTNQYLIQHSEANNELSAVEQAQVLQRDLERLRLMTFYCTTEDCLRSYILKYFGEEHTGACGKCSNCRTHYETEDITQEAQGIITCIAATGQRFGKQMLCSILRGSKNERILSLGLDKQATYGLLKTSSEDRIRSILDYLIRNRYIEVTGEEYPYLLLTPSSSEVFTGSTAILMKAARVSKQAEKEQPQAANMLTALKRLRSELAVRQKVPAYIIFSDATLQDMCSRCPRTKEEFLQVAGVGKRKLEQYGDIFLQAIRQYLSK